MYKFGTNLLLLISSCSLMPVRTISAILHIVSKPGIFDFLVLRTSFSLHQALSVFERIV